MKKYTNSFTLLQWFSYKHDSPAKAHKQSYPARKPAYKHFLYSIFIPALLILWHQAKAQDVQLSWESGSNTASPLPVYGTKGVPDAANVPPARFQDVAWSDSSGNIWIFGGSVLTSNLNDLWRYNPATKEWTWMNGDQTSNAHGTYFTAKGVASDKNTPGARQYIANWTDKDGHFWIYGGNGYAASGNAIYLNDLWKYNPTDNTWTWVSGDSSSIGQQPRYGTQGVANANNNPGGRRGGITWTDTSGNLWLFGGYGYTIQWPITTIQFLGDLWKYSIKDNEWTWVGGVQTGSTHGSYGTKGVANAGNTPGCRQVGASWTGKDGNLWLFGGQGAAKAGPENQFMNDLWKYSIQDNEWTWVNGSDTINQRGTYGTKGITSPNNMPGARMTDAFWKDNNGNFWLLGEAWSFSASANDGYGYMNDLWKYTPQSNEWTWYAGDSVFTYIISGQGYVTGNYGTRGVPSPDNIPTGRAGGPGCADPDGNFWLFGGYGDAGGGPGMLNDLWKINVCTELSPLEGIAGQDTVCEGESLTYSVPTQKGVGFYIWHLPDGWTGSSTGDSIVTLSGHQGGTITVQAVNACDTSPVQSINVYVYPIDAIIQVSGFTLSTVEKYASYQWLLNGAAIPGATDSIYEIKQNGDYQVAVTNRAGCKDTSDIYTVNNAGIEDINTLAESISVYPNPATDKLIIQSPVNVTIVLTDVSGRLINKVDDAHVIDIRGLAPGLYLLKITDRAGALIKVSKVIKQGL